MGGFVLREDGSGSGLQEGDQLSASVMRRAGRLRPHGSSHLRVTAGAGADRSGQQHRTHEGVDTATRQVGRHAPIVTPRPVTTQPTARPPENSAVSTRARAVAASWGETSPARARSCTARDSSASRTRPSSSIAPGAGHESIVVTMQSLHPVPRTGHPPQVIVMLGASRGCGDRGGRRRDWSSPAGVDARQGEAIELTSFCRFSLGFCRVWFGLVRSRSAMFDRVWVGPEVLLS